MDDESAGRLDETLLSSRNGCVDTPQVSGPKSPGWGGVIIAPPRAIDANCPSGQNLHRERGAGKRSNHKEGRRRRPIKSADPYNSVSTVVAILANRKTGQKKKEANIDGCLPLVLLVAGPRIELGTSGL